MFGIGVDLVVEVYKSYCKILSFISWKFFAGDLLWSSVFVFVLSLSHKMQYIDHPLWANEHVIIVWHL